jgi:DNA-binding NarL/FixJ family response regulator
MTQEHESQADLDSVAEIAAAIVEDNRLVREGLASLLDQVPGVRVVVAGSSDDLSLFNEVDPDVVLLDLGLLSEDSLSVAERTRRDHPRAKIVVMDLLPVHEDIMEFVHVGVSGFIMKDATLDDLVGTMRRHDGRTTWTSASGAQRRHLPSWCLRASRKVESRLRPKERAGSCCKALMRPPTAANRRGEFRLILADMS